jgi:hypothetical protein
MARGCGCLPPFADPDYMLAHVVLVNFTEHSDEDDAPQSRSNPTSPATPGKAGHHKRGAEYCQGMK